MTTTPTMTTTTPTMTTTSPTTMSLTMATTRRLRPGFRTRVLGSFVALVAGATLAGLFFQRAVLLERLDREVEAALEQERSELVSLAGGRDPTTGQPFGGNVRAIFDTFLQRNVPLDGEAYLTFVDGSHYVSTPAPVALEQQPALLQRWTALEGGEWGDLSTDAGPVRYLAVALRFAGQTAGVFVTAYFLRGERDEIESSIRVAAVVMGIVLLAATAVAWFIAGRLLRPVRQLTETAESISDSDLGRRIPVEGNDEIARLAGRFNEMLGRLSGAFAAQRAFVDDAGHELRTPITIVRGHLELMGDDPADRQATVALVTEELDRMARIVDDLLLLANSEQPDFIRREPVELADLTADLLARCRALGERQWRLERSATGIVQLDRQRITQAMLNLARNAVEHTAAGSEVVVGSAWDGVEVRLWVRDHGPGIDASEQERIFERFSRGRDGSRRHSGGAGLGLAIVRSIATAHGGRVELQSAPGAGATFTVVLAAPRFPAGDPIETEPHHEELTMQRGAAE
jgi:signal transduction histidine kinase